MEHSGFAASAFFGSLTLALPLLSSMQFELLSAFTLAFWVKADLGAWRRKNRFLTMPAYTDAR